MGFPTGLDERQTPHEFADAIAVRNPVTASAARVLADAFARSRWGGTASDDGGDALDEAWRRVRSALVMSWLPFGRRRHAPVR